MPLNNLTLLLSFPAVFLAASYPFTKRFLAIPQAYLGIAFGFGIPVADRCNLHDVLRGIHAAQDAGLAPIRLNAVLLRGINGMEAMRLIDFSIRERLELRFMGNC